MAMETTGRMERSLRVHGSGRYLEHPDGRPFFYLADTAWELFHRLSREQAERYLRDRAKKGFTAIQAVVLAELDGLHTPNPAGHRPLRDSDPARPDEGYFGDVDWIVNKAAELGLFVAMLPTWGDKWHKRTSPDDAVIFTAENAFSYGRFLGRRYRSSPIIWVLGGDRPVQDDGERAIVCAMARGLGEGDGGRHLKTFHPCGQYSSAMWFHDEPWLDFNMIQTGHTRDRDNYNSIAAEYGRTPVKPCVDGEPGYENHPHAFNVVHGRMDAHQARKFIYWSLFAGACGHTYGCHDIWQMWEPGRTPKTWADTPWDKAIDFPGAGQMQHARRLIESGPYFDRLPDPSLIASLNPTGADHVQACRGPDARYALVYVPTGQSVTLRLFLLLARKLAVSWMDPRTGERKPAPEIEVGPHMSATFTPPGAGDWVLILARA